MHRVGMAAAAAGIALGLSAGGCVTGGSPNPQGADQYSGYVFCFRGLINIFSFGMDAMAGRLRDLGIDARTVWAGSYPWAASQIRSLRASGDFGKIVLLGHSHGADDAIRAAWLLNDASIWVDLIVTIDPVDPPPIPPNVERAYNIYWSQPLVDPLPVFRGTRIRRDPNSRAEICNLDLRTSRVPLNPGWMDHFNIEDTTAVQNLAIEQIVQAMRSTGRVPPAGRSWTVVK